MNNFTAPLLFSWVQDGCCTSRHHVYNSVRKRKKEILATRFKLSFLFHESKSLSRSSPAKVYLGLIIQQCELWISFVARVQGSRVLCVPYAQLLDAYVRGLRFPLKKKDNSELTPLRVLDSHIMNIAVTQKIVSPDSFEVILKKSMNS